MQRYNGLERTLALWVHLANLEAQRVDIGPGDIVNAGVNAFTVYLLVRVLNRLDDVVDRLFKYLEEAKQQRETLLEAQGLPTGPKIP